MKSDLPPLPAGFEYRLDLAGHVTPRLIKDRPVHRWFYFPHSYSPQLIELLLDEWQVEPGAPVIDPFVGAGTTLRVAAERGHPAIGTDNSPLAVFVSRAKMRDYDAAQVREGLCQVLEQAERGAADVARTERLQRAFTDAEFAELVRLREAIREQPDTINPLLLLALMRVQQGVSRAQPDGGWFRWVEREDESAHIRADFAATVESVLADLACAPGLESQQSIVKLHDARFLADLSEDYPHALGTVGAIITSPPYPNRHDYSRIFQIELLTLGLDESDIFDLRYGSVRSHVEARPPDRRLPAFRPPKTLERAIEQLRGKADRRIEPMLCGYFEDMNAVLHDAFQILAPGGHIALVVGNVRHGGVMIPVDEILVEVGAAIGYEPMTSWVARLRGNSAQQMGRFGREPARESVVILGKG